MRTPPIEDGLFGDETVRVILQVAAGELDEPTLADWISARLAKGADER